MILIFQHFLPHFLRKLDLSYCGLENEEMSSDIGELSNLLELNVSHNSFSRLHFSLSQLTRLKILNLTACNNLIELPELPSSIAILIADFCDSLISVGDFHTECEWLCHVSFLKEMTTSPIVGVPGSEKLLGSMLKVC